MGIYDTINLNSGSGSPTDLTQIGGASDSSPATTTTSSTDNSANISADIRVRLSAMPGQAAQVYGPQGDNTNILTILHETGGLLFPYTPTISVSQNVVYRDIELVHTNSDIAAYSRTSSAGLSVTGKFTIQNQREGRYALAALHFLRTVSKMYFGEVDNTKGTAGTPPPVLMFSGYGNYIFNNLPVIVKSHSYSFDDTKDMVTIQTASGSARMPAIFQISMDLTVQQTPGNMRKKFNLDDFRTGKLLRDTGATGLGWI